MTRRQFLTLGPAAVGALTLAACSPSPAPTEIAPTSTPQEIAGFLESQFSDVIRNNHLVPTVLSFEEKGLNPQQINETRILDSQKYITLYRDGLADDRKYQGVPLSDYKINVGNIPIAIPYFEDADWTIWHVGDTLIHELTEGKTNLFYDPTLDNTTGEARAEVNVRKPDFQNWTRGSIIWLGEFLTRRDQYVENDSSYYSGVTNVDVAVEIFTQFAHVLQYELFFTEFFNRVNAGEEHLTFLWEKTEKEGVGAIHAWVVGKMKEAVNIFKDQHLVGKLPEGYVKKVNPMLAQARAIGLMFYHQLNVMNDGSEHFPGARRTDPIDKPSLYPLFVNTVINSPDHAMDIEWIATAGMRE